MYIAMAAVLTVVAISLVLLNIRVRRLEASVSKLKLDKDYLLFPYLCNDIDHHFASISDDEFLAAAKKAGFVLVRKSEGEQE